jgi:hypothetical protein
VPSEVDAALAVLRSFVAEQGGPVDAVEGERLREKVAAYLVLADDLGLDADRLQPLLGRWSAVTDAAATSTRRAGRPAARPAATAPADATLTACPVCGERFKRVNKHLSAAHPQEWAARQSAS